MEPIGRRRWAIPAGDIPDGSTGPAPEMTSHETACILNASDDEAHVEITVYFSDRDPVQHTRLDSRQAENALLTTTAFPADA